MTITDAQRKLYDTTFLIGHQRRRTAIRTLAASPDPVNTVLLAEALANNHPNSAAIIRELQRLSLERDHEKVAALWMAWIPGPQIPLARVLAHLGWPPMQTMEIHNARALLALATANTAPEILQTVAVFAQSLPVADEIWNDAIHVAWVRSQSDELERVITEQARQPGNPALEALHALVTGAITRYTALSDEDGAFLARAFVMAPPAFRDRMARTVANHPDRHLKERYRLTLSGAGMDENGMIANLKLVGDEEGLFEKIRFLRLGAVLSICEHWATKPGRPSRINLREVVDRAVTAYRKLSKFQLNPVPDLPIGLVDIFDYWRRQPSIVTELVADLQAPDPVRKARGLYLGRKQGLIDPVRLTTATHHAHWLERLIARLIDPATLAKSKEDHVLWVSLCANEGALLQTTIAGTPEDLHYHLNLLQRIPLTTSPRIRALLEILCAFQGAFVASGISIDEIDEALESSAIEIEEAEDAEEF